MTSIKTLNYDIRDLNGDLTANKSISISLKTNESSSKYLIHKAIVIQDRLKRQGNASCKTRSEVQGGGKKPWKQKGTGRARAGSSNSPLWRGGGVTFGPYTRSYYKKINKKEKQLALSTTLYNSSNKITVVENTFNQVQKPSTKEILHLITSVGKIKKDSKTLIIVHEIDSNLSLSIRNLSNINLLYSNTLNIRDLLLAKNIIITEKALVDITTL
jgi:large subunit ribosomal protein L4